MEILEKHTLEFSVVGRLHDAFIRTFIDVIGDSLPCLLSLEVSILVFVDRSVESTLHGVLFQGLSRLMIKKAENRVS